MKKRRIKCSALLLCIVMLAGLFVGCGSQEVVSEPTSEPTATPKPGVSQTKLDMVLGFIEEGDIEELKEYCKNQDFDSDMSPEQKDECREAFNALILRLFDTYTFEVKYIEGFPYFEDWNELGFLHDSEYEEEIKRKLKLDKEYRRARRIEYINKLVLEDLNDSFIGDDDTDDFAKRVESVKRDYQMDEVITQDERVGINETARAFMIDYITKWCMSQYYIFDFDIDHIEDRTENSDFYQKSTDFKSLLNLMRYLVEQELREKMDDVTFDEYIFQIAIFHASHEEQLMIMEAVKSIEAFKDYRLLKVDLEKIPTVSVEEFIAKLDESKDVENAYGKALEMLDNMDATFKDGYQKALTQWVHDAIKESYDSFKLSRAISIIDAVLAGPQAKDYKKYEAIKPELEILKSSMKSCVVIKDDFEETSDLHYKGVEKISRKTNFVPYLSKGNGLYIKLGFVKDFWLFFDSITIKADEEKIYYRFDYDDVDRVVLHTNIREMVHKYIQSYDIDDVEDIINAEKVVMRFEPDDNSEFLEHKLTSSEKKALETLYNIYKAREELSKIFK